MNAIRTFQATNKVPNGKLIQTNSQPAMEMNNMLRECMLIDENNVSKLYVITVEYVKRLTNNKVLVIYISSLSDWLQHMFLDKAAIIQKRTTEFKLQSNSLTWEYGIINEIYFSKDNAKTTASCETQIHLADQLIKKLGFTGRRIFLTVREGSGANHFTDACDSFICEVKERVHTIVNGIAPLMLHAGN